MTPSGPVPVREVWRAPAKINLWLEVLGRRSDGYHEIDTCYQKSPGLERSLTLMLKLEPSQQGARISSVQTDSRVDDTTFEGCIGQALGGVSFDAAQPTTVRIPLTFESSGE